MKHLGLLSDQFDIAGQAQVLHEPRNILQEVLRHPSCRVLDAVDSGWTQEGATFEFDTADFVIGDRSGKLTTTSGSFNAVAIKNISVNLSNKSIGMWIKKSSTITGLTIFLLAPNWSHYVSMPISISALPNNQWCFISFSAEAMSVGAGSPNLANVATVRIEALGSVNTATLNFDGLFMAENTLPSGAIIITFDDGNASDFVYAKLKMDAYGYKGVSYILPSDIDTSGKLSLDQLNKMRDAGWDICSQGMTHVNFTTLTADEIRKEVFDAKRWLLSNGFQAGARFFSYPFSAVNTLSHDIVSKYHAITRLVRPFSATQGFTGFPLFNPYTIEACDSANTPPANMLTWIQNVKAKRGLGVMLFHKLVSSSPSEYEYLIADFNTFIDNIAAQGVPVITMSDLVDRYLKLEPYDSTPYNWLNLG